MDPGSLLSAMPEALLGDAFGETSRLESHGS